MKNWSADWGNDPYDDYNLVLEIICDDKEVAVIKQSPQGLILNWYISPKGLIIPVDWLSSLLLGAKEGIVDPTTTIEEIVIGQWTSDFVNGPCGDNKAIVKLLCDSKDMAVIKQRQQGLVLEWYASPKGLIILVDWLSELLLEAKRSMDDNK